MSMRRDDGPLSPSGKRSGSVEEAAGSSPRLRDDASEGAASSFSNAVSGGAASPDSVSLKDSRRPPKGGNSRATTDLVDVIVRLKPHSLKNVLPKKNYIRYEIESGTLDTPRTSRRSAVHTPRTARLLPSRTPNSPVPAPISARVGRAAPVEESRSESVKRGTKGTLLTLWGPRSATDPTEEQRQYELGQVFEPEMTDDEVCDSIIPSILEQLSSGFNTCVLCYGQTGSGKTHTINKLAPRLTREVSDWMGDGDVMEVSYIQIYNNKAYDLLGVSDKESLGAPLPKPSSSQSLWEPKYLVKNIASLHKQINNAQVRRCTASHELNARSSRSHTLLSVHITKYLNGVPLSTLKVTLADLAGTERVKKSGVHGTELDQAIAINKSLLALHTMIRASAAADDSNAKPFRDLLTQYIAPRLKEWHIILIVTASLEKNFFSETKSSLEFATTAKKCKVTKMRPKATINYSDSSHGRQALTSLVEELRFQVSQLQEELSMERQRSEFKTPGSPKSMTSLSQDHLPSSRSDDKERIKDITTRHEYLQKLLKEKEEELDSALPEHSSQEDLLWKVEEERRVVDELFEELKMKQNDEGFDDSLESLKDSFLCVLERLNSSLEQNAVQQQALDSIRSDYHKLSTKLVEFRKEKLQQESKHKEMSSELQMLRTERTSLQTKLEETELQMYVNAVDRAVREECLQLYEIKNIQETDEVKNYKKQLAEQAALYDNQQARLADMENELHEWQNKKKSMDEAAATTTQTMAAIWAVLSPQQKLQFVNGSGLQSTPIFSPSGRASGGGGSGSVVTAQENLVLQREVRELRNLLEEERKRSREKDYEAEDLREKLKQTQLRLDRSNENYRGLHHLEETLATGKELMEQQMADYNTFMDSHIQQLQHLKIQVKNAHATSDGLRGELEHASRRIEKLESKIDALHKANETTISEREMEQDLWLEERESYEIKIENLEGELQELSERHEKLERKLTEALTRAPSNSKGDSVRAHPDTPSKAEVKGNADETPESRKTKVLGSTLTRRSTSKKRGISSSVVPSRPSTQEVSDVKGVRRFEKKAPPDVINIRSVSMPYR